MPNVNKVSYSFLILWRGDKGEGRLPTQRGKEEGSFRKKRGGRGRG